jgi:hypothetical protein
MIPRFVVDIFGFMMLSEFVASAEEEDFAFEDDNEDDASCPSPIVFSSKVERMYSSDRIAVSAVVIAR